MVWKKGTDGENTASTNRTDMEKKKKAYGRRCLKKKSKEIEWLAAIVYLRLLAETFQVSHHPPSLNLFPRYSKAQKNPFEGI